MRVTIDVDPFSFLWMILSAALLALTLTTPVSEPVACYDSIVLGFVERADDITPLPGLALGATGEWTIRVSHHESGAGTPASIVAKAQAESLPTPKTALRIFLRKDGPKHYSAVFWSFADSRSTAPGDLRACS